MKLIQKFPCEIIAVDEVGRSPLSGPVVIGGVRIFINDSESLLMLLRSLRRNGVKDSKLLSTQKRINLLNKFRIDLRPFRDEGQFKWKGIEFKYVTWEMSPEVIDQENIFQASMRGMKEVAMNLSTSDKAITTVLIDGPAKLRWTSGPLSWNEIPLIRGDVRSSLIGLAAIIAKETRDNYMREMHLIYPKYGFDSHYGYPTRQHREALELYGPCSLHRKSFGKLKQNA